MRLNKKIIMIFLVVVCMLVLTFIYSLILFKTSEEEKEKNKINSLIQEMLSSTSENYASLDLFTIYGNHLNIEGEITREFENITDVEVSLMNITGEEIVYPTIYFVIVDHIEYSLSEKINEGIDLDKLLSGRYILMLKVKYVENEEEKVAYYTINNVSSYGDTEYYTITNEGKNNKVNISFNNLLDKNYMEILTNLCYAPDDVYDIVLDAGHGGKDVGAMYEDEKEAYYTLKCTLAIKDALEKEGFKVALTRDKDEYVASYGEKSRAALPFETRAKLVLSIHLNSTVQKTSEGGLEVYAPNNANLDFARHMAYNISNNAEVDYSPNNIQKAYPGVYVRTYTEEEVKEAIEYADELNYPKYETLDTQTNYLFMIRETGGIMTGAYIDGRNKNYEENIYRNSNIAAEGYLIELGFINSTKDLTNLKYNQKAYIDAIVGTIVENYREK